MEPESKKQTIDNEHPETNQQNQQQHTNTDESVEESSNNNINNSTMSMSGSSSRNFTMSGSDTMMNESEASSSVSNISKRREKARTEINRNFLVCLFNILLLDETFNKIASFNNDSSAFFLWVRTHLSENQHVKELCSLSKRKADKRMSPHTKATSSLHDNEDIVLQELGTGQIKQILRAAYSLVIFAKNDARIETIFTFAIMENCASSYFVNAGSYLSLVLDGKRATKTMSKSSVLELSAPSNLEVLIYFHCVNYLTNGSDRIKKSSVTATRLGYAVQTVLYCWTRMAKNVKIEHDGKLSTLLMPYILYQSEKGVFDVIDTKSKGFATTQQTRSFDNIYATVQEREVDPIAFNLSEDIDKALRFIIRMMFNELHTIVKKQFLYVCSEKDLKEWEDLEKFRLPSSETDIPQVFTDLPDDVCTALGVTKPEPQSEVLEVIVVSDVDEELEIQPTVKGDTGGKRKQIGGEEERLMKKKQRVEADNEITSAKIIKEEPIHEIEPGNSTKLSTSADNAFDTLNAEMCSRFGLFDCAFTDLEEEVQDAMGVDLENQVDLLLTDPPYGTRKELKKPNSGHDELTAEDMKNFAKFAGRVLKPGGHGIIFCSDLQFKDWFLALSKIREEEPDYEADDSGAVMKSVAKFKVESISLNFIRAPGYYQSNPVRNNLTHASVVERAIHFWRRGESLSEERKKVDYASTSSSSSTYPGWTNVVTNVQRPTAEEIVYMKDNNENGNAANRIMVRPEQKGILWMSNLIEKFSKPGDLVVDCFSGTFSVAKACFLLSKHRRFIGCDKDPVCLERTEDKLIEIFARQLLNPRSDISTNEEGLITSAQDLIAEIERVKVTKRASSWNTPKGLSPMQNFPDYIVQYLCQYHKDMSLAHSGSRLPMIRWNSQWTRRMNNVDVKALQSLECIQLGVHIKTSNIKHPLAGLGVFASRDFDEGEIVGYYYGSLVYGDIGESKKPSKAYGEGVLAVNSEQFNKWAVDIKHKFIDTGGNEYHGYIAPAPWCPMRYINDPRFLRQDKATTEERRLGREANVRFEQNQRACLNRDFEIYTMMAIRCVCAIQRGEEFYIPYGSNYQFVSPESGQIE